MKYTIYKLKLDGSYMYAMVVAGVKGKPNTAIATGWCDSIPGLLACKTTTSGMRDDYLNSYPVAYSSNKLPTKQTNPELFI